MNKPASHRGSGATSLGYQPALDGLRAISVIAVVLYHAGFDWMHGGFFGVEVFFVISGFLITSLLIEERGLGGVLHQLAQVEGAQAARLHGLARQPHPAGQPVAAHHRGRELHGECHRHREGRSAPV